MKISKNCKKSLQHIVLGTTIFSFACGLARAADPNNKQLYAVPRPGEVKIDGLLNDWDMSGQIEVFVSPDTRATRNAKFAVMYDDNAIYIGAHVKDSTPMLNRYDPRAMADKAWKPDQCQFRLATDPAITADTRLSEFDLQDGFKTELQRQQPVQLQLWYYTDERKPSLMLTKSFKYIPIREEWAPHGVAPDTAYQAAYRTDDDKQGYTFEYRVPWTSLNAGTLHPKAGDRVPSNLQIHWGDDTGLESAAGGWAYDLMRRPGFPFQSMESWGTLIFSPTGNLDPSLTASPSNRPKPVEPQPLEFKYELPKDSEITISLYDAENRLVRNIVAQAWRKAGAHVERWDGLDENGNFLPAGEYRWKGIYHDPITTRYVMSVANSGRPGWKTADGSGGWGGDYGPPMDIKAAGDRLIMAWQSGEASPSLISTDLTGQKKWGLTHRHSNHLATDGKRFFAAPENHVEVFEVASGKPMPFGTGRPQLDAPPGAANAKQDNEVSGLTWNAGLLYVSYRLRNLVAVYDATTGDLKSTINLPAPGRAVGIGANELLIISNKSVVRVDGAGNVAPFPLTNLDSPSGIALDGKGNIYVSNHGALHNVSVFSPQGKYLRSIGKPGGRPYVGRFVKEGMLHPGGITVSQDGKLWVPESIGSPKRVSVWDAATGKYLNQFFGANSYSPTAWIDPANPKELIHDENIWKIDLNKGTWEPYSTFYRQRAANQIGTGGGGFMWPFRTVTAENGKQYGFSNVFGYGSVLWIRDKEFFRPLHYLFQNYPNPQLGLHQAFDLVKDRNAYPSDARFHWADANGDMTVQSEELTRLPGSTGHVFWVDSKLRLWNREGQMFAPVSIDKKGVPKYDFLKPVKVRDTRVHEMWTNTEGTEVFSYTLANGRSSDGIGLAGWTTEGKRQWSTLPIINWGDSLNYSQIKPGPLFGATSGLGAAGDFTGITRYFAFYDIFRKDGMYVGRLLKPSVLGEHGPDALYVEFLYGQMVKPRGMDRYFVVGGDQDVRVLEVLGLNSIKDLPGGTFTLTGEQQKTVRIAWEDYHRQLAGPQQLAIVPGGADSLKNATPVKRELDGGRSFSAAAAYDAQNLYVRYSVKSPAKLVNSIPDPQVVFKGGNLLDIQLAADPAADAARKTPAVGDMRILISRRAGQPHAVVFRPRTAGGGAGRITLTSPTGTESFDSIAVTDRIALRDYVETADGFTVTAVLPLDLLGWKPEAGKTVKMDLGYVFGNVDGAQAVQRAYWNNNSFTANVLNDIPHESRIEPGQWGTAMVQ